MPDIPCPRCQRSDLPEGWTWCHACREYRVIMLAEEEGETPARAKPAIPDTRSEEEIRRAIVEAVELHGFVVVDLEQGYRADGSSRVRKGLADLAIMGFGVFAWAEIKSATGRQTKYQKEFEADCRKAGIPYLLWRHQSEAISWAREVRAGRAVA